MIAWRKPGLKTAGAVALALLAAVSGCKLRARATQAPPAPAVTAVSEPLSTPQTAERLPPAQPIPPGAIPDEPAEPEVPAAEPAPVPPPKAAPRPRPAAPVAAQTPPPAVTAPAPTRPPDAGPQLRPAFTPAQEKELRRRIDRSLTAARQALTEAAKLPPDQERSEAAIRVRAFLEQAEEARQQGDLERARSLAERAEFLAADLARVSK